MRISLFVVILIAVVSGFQITNAADLTNKHPVVNLGEGTISCGRWIGYRASHVITQAEVEAWVRGFLTGMNAADPTRHGVGDGSDPEGNNLWLDNYCKAHPLDSLYDAAILLRVALINNSN